MMYLASGSDDGIADKEGAEELQGHVILAEGFNCLRCGICSHALRFW